jgi:hypothetical protein
MNPGMNEEALRQSVARSLETKRRFFEQHAASWWRPANGSRPLRATAGCTFGGGRPRTRSISRRTRRPLPERRPALSALALTTDASAVTAITNDFGFERVFARQLGPQPAGDVAFGITTSGRSPNVMRPRCGGSRAGARHDRHDRQGRLASWSASPTC